MTLSNEYIRVINSYLDKFIKNSRDQPDAVIYNNWMKCVNLIYRINFPDVSEAINYIKEVMNDISNWRCSKQSISDREIEYLEKITEVGSRIPNISGEDYQHRLRRQFFTPEALSVLRDTGDKNLNNRNAYKYASRLYDEVKEIMGHGQSRAWTNQFIYTMSAIVDEIERKIQPNPITKYYLQSLWNSLSRPTLLDLNKIDINHPPRVIIN